MKPVMPFPRILVSLRRYLFRSISRSSWRSYLRFYNSIASMFPSVRAIDSLRLFSSASLFRRCLYSRTFFMWCSLSRASTIFSILPSLSSMF
jgi:hypothetical protein